MSTPAPQKPSPEAEAQKLKTYAMGAIGAIAAIAFLAFTSGTQRPASDTTGGPGSGSISRPVSQGVATPVPKPSTPPAPQQQAIAPPMAQGSTAPTMQAPAPTTAPAGQKAAATPAAKALPPAPPTDPKGNTPAATEAPPSSPTTARPTVAAKQAPESTATPPEAPKVATAPASPPLPQSSQTQIQSVPAPAAVATRPSMKIQEITTPLGIKAWLVEERSVPLMALRFGFEGGSSQDPKGKEGVSNFITGMMDEGAGDIDAITFQKRMEELAMRMSFDTSADSFYGSFETLTENRKAAVDLLALALQKPRFDKDAVDRVRGQYKSGLVFAARNPSTVAGETTMRLIYGDHPYGATTKGTALSLDAITGADLEAYRKRIFARDTLRVVAVGDINAKELSDILDQLFGALPAKAELVPVPAITAKAQEKLKVVDMAVPQSEVRFGVPGLLRHDKDFMAAFVVNHILGGGGFSARLMEEVREKRGLAYSAYSYLQPMKKSGVMIGGVATKNEQVATSIEVIRAELKRLAAEGPTATELANAKSNLTGSFALRFDTNAKIASQLLFFSMEDLGVSYIERRNGEVAAVTIEDAKRVAKRLLDNDELFFVVVGRPQGLPRT
jgi:zinc protease